MGWPGGNKNTKTKLDCSTENPISSCKKEINQIPQKCDYYREAWISKTHQGKCIAEIIYFMPTELFDKIV